MSLANKSVNFFPSKEEKNPASQEVIIWSGWSVRWHFTKKCFFYIANGWKEGPSTTSCFLDKPLSVSMYMCGRDHSSLWTFKYLIKVLTLSSGSRQSSRSKYAVRRKAKWQREGSETHRPCQRKASVIFKWNLVWEPQEHVIWHDLLRETAPQNKSIRSIKIWWSCFRCRKKKTAGLDINIVMMDSWEKHWSKAWWRCRINHIMQ